MPPSRYSVGTYPKTSSLATCQENIRPQSSQLAEPLWTDPGLKSGISVRQLISIKKQKNMENEWSNILPKSSQARIKATITTTTTTSAWFCGLIYFLGSAGAISSNM